MQLTTLTPTAAWPGIAEQNPGLRHVSTTQLNRPTSLKYLRMMRRWFMTNSWCKNRSRGLTTDAMWLLGGLHPAQLLVQKNRKWLVEPSISLVSSSWRPYCQDFRGHVFSFGVGPIRGKHPADVGPRSQCILHNPLPFSRGDDRNK